MLLVMMNIASGLRLYYCNHDDLDAQQFVNPAGRALTQGLFMKEEVQYMCDLMGVNTTKGHIDCIWLYETEYRRSTDID